jgi:heparan-alpha-glucosaminide N-acetyltransferase
MAESSDAALAVEPRPQRLHSLDAYRGLIMISLAFVGFGLASTASNHLDESPDSNVWQQVHYQFSHAQWVGCSYWDLIQPSFMFMVGVSMAWSYAKRQREGDSYRRMLFHAITRSVVLVLLSVFLMSSYDRYTNWTFMNVLAQIGLGYTFVFLLWGRSFKVQALTAVLILVGTWVAWEAYPDSGMDPSVGDPDVGVDRDWAAENLTGIRSAWQKNANLGHAVDRVVLNWFPRPEPFLFNRGGYQTINFIPSIVTMLFGLMCGELLRSRRSAGQQLLILLAAAAVGLSAGWSLHAFGVCPLVKRIWTPSWTLFSTGWCCLILASLYLVIDVVKLRRWSMPLIVVGTNSLVMYCMSMTLKPWTARRLQTHLGDGVFTFYDFVPTAWEPTVQACLVGLMLWLVCYYLWRHRIFVRI